MGTYLIPNAPSTTEAVDYIGEPQLTQTWERAGPDILFTDTALPDAGCAALYADYIPSGQTDGQYRKPDPPQVRAAKATLKAFYNANPSSIDNTQSATLTRALVVVLHHLHGEVVDE